VPTEVIDDKYEWQVEREGGKDLDLVWQIVKSVELAYY
jgi:hypothetical protein